VVLLIAEFLWASLSSRIHPIKILKTKATLMLCLMIALPFLLINLQTPLHLFLIQASILLLALTAMPAVAILMYHLPISRRFTFASFLYAVAYALIYIVTSFGLVYLGSYFGHFGLWFITLPITLSFLYGVLYFEGLERKTGHLFKSLPQMPYKKLSEQPVES
jgi:hypothetical protein